jgi:hypothetical protein
MRSIGLFDAHVAVALAHCLFNIPLAVWILEGFMSGVPRELDETTFVDGYPRPSMRAHHQLSGPIQRTSCSPRRRRGTLTKAQSKLAQTGTSAAASRRRSPRSESTVLRRG